MTQTITTPSATRGGRVHRAWWIAAAAALTVMAAGAFSTMPGLLVTPLHRDLGWSRGSIGFAVWVNMAVTGLVAPFATALMDRFGLRRVAAGALVAVGAGAALTAVMTQPWQLTLYWGLLVGLGCGSVAMGFAAVVVQRWFGARRGLVTGILTAAGVFGQFAFLPLLSRGIDRYQWRPVTVTVALAALALVPLAWLLLRDHPADLGLRPYGSGRPVPPPAPVPGAARHAVAVLRAAARTRTFWLLAGTFAICGASTNGVMWTGFVPAAHDHGMPTTVAAGLLSLIGVFNVAGTVLSGWLTDRHDPRLLLSCYYGMRALSLVCLPYLLGPEAHWPLIAFVVFFGLLDVATVPPTIALSAVREVYGERSGAIVFGWTLAFHQVGAGLMAFAGGLLRDSLGSYDLVWFGSALLCAVAALLAAAIGRPGPAAGAGKSG
ncbi:MFS transporter [Streptomyces sp. TRM 70361]|uniref:MFS transporter n=1 Tax=Streptomyces sp. TRM 70361 TaxID=3116553 RepID=UPI002E7BE206|nr:MFS transporter [Streptomyces sp. TRM 70361]MEE1940190.1 MFS transporter [Streptomyces sp. TRM 70361]